MTPRSYPPVASIPTRVTPAAAIVAASFLQPTAVLGTCDTVDALAHRAALESQDTGQPTVSCGDVATFICGVQLVVTALSWACARPSPAPSQWSKILLLLTRRERS